MKSLFYLLALLSLNSGCKKSGYIPPTPVTNPPPVTPPTTPVWDPNAMRAVWITTTASTALSSKANIEATVENCRLAGINTIFMVVYNSARTTYPSTVMQNLVGVPILESMSGRDPLKEMIDAAHAKNIKVHAWFEYGFAAFFSTDGGPIVAAKPAWAARDINNQLCVKNGFSWLNSFHPEVQNYMIDLFKEVTTRYDIDGVQGDDRLPAAPASAGYDTYTTALYQSQHGGNTPPASATDAGWVKWRAGLLSGFLKRLRTEVKAIKPGIAFTMAPSIYPFSLTEYLQDWPSWVDSSLVDKVIPQLYRYDIASYTSTLTAQKNYLKGNTDICIPGVLLKTGTYLPTDDYLTQEIKINRSLGFKGEAFFFYEGIKDKLPYFISQYPFIK